MEDGEVCKKQEEMFGRQGEAAQLFLSTLWPAIIEETSRQAGCHHHHHSCRRRRLQVPPFVVSHQLLLLLL